MEQIVGGQVKGFFSNMGDELKTFKLGSWAKYIAYIASLMILFAGFGFGAGWWSILIILFGLFLVMLEYVSCFKCFKPMKIFAEKTDFLQTPLYKGLLYVIIGIISWKAGWICSIVAIICGLLFVLGSFFDKKKDNAKAPMV